MAELRTEGCGDRYLSEGSKAAEVAAWGRLLNELPWNHAEDPEDRGLPDADMVPWCRRLNELPGLCTVQSCAGHRNGPWKDFGHLWLRMTESVFRRFTDRAHELAKHELIEHVALEFKSYGQDVAAIRFHGNERGALAESMGVICAFLTSVAEEAQR